MAVAERVNVANLEELSSIREYVGHIPSLLNGIALQANIITPMIGNIEEWAKDGAVLVEAMEHQPPERSFVALASRLRDASDRLLAIAASGQDCASSR